MMSFKWTVQYKSAKGIEYNIKGSEIGLNNWYYQLRNIFFLTS